MRRCVQSYSILVAVLLVCIFIAIPNYFQRGKTQLIYIDRTGNKIATPLSVYVLNVLFPEEEVMNLGMKAIAFLPPAKLSPVFRNTGSSLIRDAQRDFWNGKALAFYAPYNKLSLQGSNPGSFAIAQACNETIGSKYNGVYITRPQHYDRNKEYPIVFFAHGYLGSWELYQGILSGLENCFIVSIGTRDLTGIFTYDDINRIFKEYLPLLKAEGYKIDMNHLHLIGLSNGGTASNIALRNFSDRFRTIVYVSTSCDVVKHSRAKILMIGGGHDVSASALPKASKRLQRYGTKTAVFFNEEDNHYIMVHKRKQIMEFLNLEMELIS